MVLSCITGMSMPLFQGLYPDTKIVVAQSALLCCECMWQQALKGRP